MPASGRFFEVPWCARSAMREVSVVQFWKRMHEHFSQLHEARVRDEGKQRRVCNVAVPEYAA